eukprot:355749-Chlamydomonas_euryale.AAC.6
MQNALHSHHLLSPACPHQLQTPVQLPNLAVKRCIDCAWRAVDYKAQSRCCFMRLQWNQVGWAATPSVPLLVYSQPSSTGSWARLKIP